MSNDLVDPDRKLPGSVVSVEMPAGWFCLVVLLSFISFVLRGESSTQLKRKYLKLTDDIRLKYV